MSNASDLQETLPEISALPKDQVEEEDMPLPNFLLQAEKIYQACLVCKNDLIKGKIDWGLVEKIPTLCRSIRQLLSTWAEVKFDNPDLQQLWVTKKDEAAKLLDDLIEAFKFAFRKNPALLDSVSKIAEGNSNPDLIQDLNDASVLGKSNIQYLEKIDFDLSLLDKSAASSSELATLFAKASVVKKTTPESEVLQQKAYTLLRSIVDEVIQFGKFTYRKDPDMAGLFELTYPAKRKKKSTPKKNNGKNSGTKMSDPANSFAGGNAVKEESSESDYSAEEQSAVSEKDDSVKK